MPKDWWKEEAAGIPRLVTETPGPKSRVMHANTTRYMKGLSSQVKLFPVCFDSGYGSTLTDVDGNRYLDFSSGKYVTFRPLPSENSRSDSLLVEETHEHP